LPRSDRQLLDVPVSRKRLRRTRETGRFRRCSFGWRSERVTRSVGIDGLGGEVTKGVVGAQERAHERSTPEQDLEGC
ncbi:hypothetical protein P4809_15210, partial [Listeria monocytogenes]|nr:hypothetical protein [Listeria monocytogenes]